MNDSVRYLKTKEYEHAISCGVGRIHYTVDGKSGVWEMLCTANDDLEGELRRIKPEATFIRATFISDAEQRGLRTPEPIP